MSRPAIRIMIDQPSGSTRELGRIESKDGNVVYSAACSLIETEKNRRIITQSLLKWVAGLNDQAYSEDEKKEPE